MCGPVQLRKRMQWERRSLVNFPKSGSWGRQLLSVASFLWNVPTVLLSTWLPLLLFIQCAFFGSVSIKCGTLPQQQKNRRRQIPMVIFCTHFLLPSNVCTSISMWTIEVTQRTEEESHVLYFVYEKNCWIKYCFPRVWCVYEAKYL